MTPVPEQDPSLGRWDSIGEPGEGLDELQGLYSADAILGTSFLSMVMNQLRPETCRPQPPRSPRHCGAS